jgi:peptidyl-Lys metalloendopeptidase
MLTRKHMGFALAAALILAFVTLGAYSPAGAAGGAAVRLSTDQAAYSAGQAVVVQVTVSNPTGKALKVLKWYTPAEDVEEPLFNVTLDGQPVAYLGAIYKRPAPTGADYVTLKPGDSFTRAVDLAAYYDLTASGNYTIRYAAASPELYSEKGSGVVKHVETLDSNEVSVWVEGRASGPQLETITPQAVTGATSFNKCTTTQVSGATAARTQASIYSADALSYLKANKTGARYTTWFGLVTSSRYTTATNHFTAISGAMDTAPVTIDCGCKKNYYAYVYANKPYIIYVCKAFWSAPLTGTDSRAGTLIHEMSHFTVVAGTNDYVYGQAGAQSLAISNPNNAVNNADNHEYFAENTPTLP